VSFTHVYDEQLHENFPWQQPPISSTAASTDVALQVATSGGIASPAAQVHPLGSFVQPICSPVPACPPPPPSRPAMPLVPAAPPLPACPMTAGLAPPPQATELMVKQSRTRAQRRHPASFIARN
jgi:hypothetical protein